MLIPPKYILTNSITECLGSIEAARQVIETYPLPPEIETNIRRQSILRSSLFSARIEGNPLTMDDYTNKPSGDQKKREVMNILKGLHFVHERVARDLTVNAILQIHAVVMDGLIDKSHCGKFRTEVSAIFNSAGFAIYMPPPPRQVPKLVERMIAYSNNPKEQFIPIRAVLTHYIFEKIHPFLDGNGRVGRLVMQAVLGKGGYGMKGLLAIEEYLDEHRSAYYRALEESERDVTGYVEFMLEALATSADIAKNQVISKQQAEVSDYLLPRRAEILHIIRDHKIVNFDMIQRRFVAINERTLRYDLKKLCDAGLVRKRGTTKGVYYETI
jgi:Fic family protein